MDEYKDLSQEEGPKEESPRRPGAAFAYIKHL